MENTNLDNNIENVDLNNDNLNNDNLDYNDQESVGDAFSNITQTPEFSNLMSSILGSVQNGLSNQNINMENIFNTCNFENNLDKSEQVSSIDSIENTSDISDNSDNSDILECEISQSGLTESIENVNFKITELGNMLHNLFTDSQGNTITDILSDISKKIDFHKN